MKVSTKGRYGLRIMTYLASTSGDSPVLAETIARDQDISAKYIHIIVGSLKQAGLVRVLRGRKGGYVLARDPSEITALEVVNALEGSIAPVDCVNATSSCKRFDCCAVRKLWIDVFEAINLVLDGVTIEQLAEKQKEIKQINSMYTI